MQQIEHTPCMKALPLFKHKNLRQCALSTSSFTLCASVFIVSESGLSATVKDKQTCWAFEKLQNQSPTCFDCGCHLFGRTEYSPKWKGKLNVDTITLKSINHNFTFRKNMPVDLYLSSLIHSAFFKPSFSHCVTVVLSFPTVVRCCLPANNNHAVIAFSRSFVMVSTSFKSTLKIEEESELCSPYFSKLAWGLLSGVNTISLHNQRLLYVLTSVL